MRVTVAHDGPRVRVEVSDTGPGIAQEDEPRVFDRFYTTRAVASPTGTESHTRKEKGTGLALVKAVAEAHGGEASVRSGSESGGRGRGAIFRVTLPGLPPER